MTLEKHMVVCVKCGRRFDANKERAGYVEKSRRYVCGKCFAEQRKRDKEAEKSRKAREAEERERVTGMRQSKPAMIAKIVVGVLFALCSVPFAAQGNFSSFAVGLVIAAALIAWGVVPYMRAQKRE